MLGTFKLLKFAAEISNKKCQETLMVGNFVQGISYKQNN